MFGRLFRTWIQTNVGHQVIVKQRTTSHSKDNWFLNQRFTSTRPSLNPILGIIVEKDTCLPQVVLEVKQYLESQLKASLPDIKFVERTVEGGVSDEMLSELDSQEVSFVISLGEDVLERGVTYLRNKDTALWEEVHVSRLVNLVNGSFGIRTIDPEKRKRKKEGKKPKTMTTNQSDT